MAVSRHLGSGDRFVVNKMVGRRETAEYGFHDGFNINVDLGSSNEVGTCRNKFWFCREFVKLGTCFT